MLIARFGTVWDTAYVLPTLKASDNWVPTRPPVIARVSGVSGAFDYYGDDNFPLSPLDITKTFTLEGSSYSNVETLRVALLDETIALGRTKLWGLWRDGTTHVWTWAKCISMKAVETAAEKTSLLMNVEARFQCFTGFWYGESRQSWIETIVVPASTIAEAATGLDNAGNANALVDVKIIPQDGLTIGPTTVQVRGTSMWQQLVEVDDGEMLSVLASRYKTVLALLVDEKDSVATVAGSSGAWGDGRHVFVARTGDGVSSYDVDSVGGLTLLDTDDQGDSAQDVWGNGQFLLLANNTGGLLSYTVAADGTLTFVDSDDQGDNAVGVDGDGEFIFLANLGGGLLTYSIDADGILAHIDTHDPGDSANGVYWDGNILYLANGAGGLHTYSVDDSGMLTPIDSDASTNAIGVSGDGKFIYLADGAGGLRSYSRDVDGNLTLTDTIAPPGGGAFTDVLSNGDGFVYATSDTIGIVVYEVDAVGKLTFLSSEAPLADANKIYSDGTFVYVTRGGTFRSYGVNEETDAYAALLVGSSSAYTLISYDQAAWLWLPPKRKSVIHAHIDCDAGGGGEEVELHVTWWDTYVL